MRISYLLLAAGLLLSLGGCRSLPLFGPDPRVERPLLAVMAFENRARFPIDWEIGEGISDLLADALFQTDEFRVLERGDIDAVIEELRLEESGLTREEERNLPGRIKNARFLVKGVVTEFAHVMMGGIDLGIGDWLRIGGGGVHAIVGISLKVIEVESAEIVYTRVVEGKVYAGDVEVGLTYRGVTFGGYSFFKTPIGRALRDALDDAVDGISEAIRSQPWRPVIARVDPTQIVITGGEDREVEVGSTWEVRQLGAPVVDPVTGDLLGREGGRVIGMLRVERVSDRYSVAVATWGSGFRVGQPLAEVEE